MAKRTARPRSPEAVFDRPLEDDSWISDWKNGGTALAKYLDDGDAIYQ